MSYGSHELVPVDPTLRVRVGFDARSRQFFGYVMSTETEPIVASVQTTNIFKLREQIAPWADLPTVVARKIYADSRAAERRRGQTLENGQPDELLDDSIRGGSNRAVSAFVDLDAMSDQIAAATRRDPQGARAAFDRLSEISGYHPSIMEVFHRASAAHELALAELEAERAATLPEVESPLISQLYTVDWLTILEPSTAQAVEPGELATIHAQATDVLTAVAASAESDPVGTRRSIQFFEAHHDLEPRRQEEVQAIPAVFSTLRAAYDLGRERAVGPDLRKSVDIGSVRTGLDELAQAWRLPISAAELSALHDRVEGDLREAARLDVKGTLKVFGSFYDRYTNVTPDGVARLNRAYEKGKTDSLADERHKALTNGFRQEIESALAADRVQEATPALPDLSELPVFVRRRDGDVVLDRAAKKTIGDQLLTVVARIGDDQVVGRDGALTFAIVEAAAFDVSPKVGQEFRVSRGANGRDVAQARSREREMALER